MGRMIKEAYYSHEDRAIYLAEMVENAQLMGDQHKLDYLAETFGVRPLDYDKLIENIKREDPHGIKSLLLLRMVEAEKGTDEYNRLKRLYDRYLKLTPEQRKSERVADDFWCMALHKMSIFDYKRNVQNQNLVNVFNNHLHKRIQESKQ